MDTTVKIADSYINLLSSFSDEIKLRVIRKLSESLLRGKKKETSIQDSFGAWDDDKSAEINKARVLGTRSIESFDE